jgi:Ca2+/Na+ antiporter
MSIGLPFLIFSVLAAAFVTMDNRVRLWEGGALIIIYFGFVGKVLGII